jgi:hypothetical protein
MERRDLVGRWWRRVATAALARFVLVAGLCLLDLDVDGTGGHASVMDLCFLALVAPAVLTMIAGPARRGS